MTSPCLRVSVARVCVLLSCAAFIAPGCRRVRYVEDDTSKIHVGVVFDIGGKDDRSFNAAAWRGVKCAETGTLPDGTTSCGKPALGIVLRDVEPGTPNSIEPAMRAFAERGYDLVIGVGFAQAPIMQVVARDYPNIRFAIIDGVVFADDEVVAPLGERTHRRLDGVRRPWLDVAEHDAQRRLAAAGLAVGKRPRFRALDPGPRRGIERAIVLAADVEDDADARLRGVVLCVPHAAARGRRHDGARDQRTYDDGSGRHRTSRRMTGRVGGASSPMAIASLQSASAALTPRPSR